MNEAANAAVQAGLERLVADGSQLGLQVAAYLHGELVVDAWAGVADRATGQPVTGETLFPVWSVTKGITATCLHLLAARGHVDYDAPVARYWPAFGAWGKARATVGDALTHCAGVPQLPAGTTPEALCDWEHMSAAIADLRPLFEPGTQTAYHAWTFGWIVGEVLRRVDGRPIAQFVQEEVCTPLGIQDLYLGIPDEVEPRVAALEPPPAAPGTSSPAPDSLFERAFPAALRSVFILPAVRRAVLPACGGIMSARAIARHYAALIGHVDGVRLLSQGQVGRATALQTDALDAVLGVPVPKGLGYFLGGHGSLMGARRSAFGCPGYGGASGFGDPDTGLAMGFALNRLGRTPELAADQRLVAAYDVAKQIREALGLPD